MSIIKSIYYIGNKQSNWSERSVSAGHEWWKINFPDLVGVVPAGWLD